MYMDVLPICGRYRGISRDDGFSHIRRRRNWEPFFAVYEKYLDWCAQMDATYRPEQFQILCALCEELNKRSSIRYEVILYTDQMKESPQDGTFLGFDVVGDIGESAIQEGNRIDAVYARKLNENSLFDTYADAADFCLMWNGLIQANKSPWEVEASPRPFGVWHAL